MKKTMGLLALSCLFVSVDVAASGYFIWTPTIGIGGFMVSHGKSQHIDIDTLLGNDDTVYDRNDAGIIASLGVFFDGWDNDYFNMVYGVNAFYLSKTSFSGDIRRESLTCPNLSYQYSVTHVPVYLEGKASFRNSTDRYAFTAELGLGPNIMINDYQEFPYHHLPGNVPDNFFKGRVETVFTAMAGVGVKADHILGDMPLEFGYRFFYLGEGVLTANTDEVNTSFKTGVTYAHALMLSLSI